MGIPKFNTQKFRDILEARTYIIEHREYITQHTKYKTLKNHVWEFWNHRTNKQGFFYLAIEESAIDKLSFKRIKQKLISVEQILQTHNYLILDNDLNVLSSENLSFNGNHTSQNEICARSEKGMIIFVCGPEGVDDYIDGGNISGENIFYDDKTRSAFYKKKDISRINEALKEYQDSRLLRQDVYSKFFASKIEVAGLPAAKQHTHVLKNRPERFMRDDLKDFLNTTMQGTFESEMELSISKKKIDIYVEIENKFYFFELKWLGHSINDVGKGTTTYSNARAQSGKIQALEYIQELVDGMKHDVNFGMLLIFDTRLKRKKIAYQKRVEIQIKLRPYIQHFRNHELFLENKHPA